MEGELVRGVEVVSEHCVHSHIPHTYEGAWHAEYLEKYYSMSECTKERVPRERGLGTVWNTAWEQEEVRSEEESRFHVQVSADL